VKKLENKSSEAISRGSDAKYSNKESNHDEEFDNKCMKKRNIAP